MTAPAVAWLAALAPHVPELSSADWAWLGELEEALIVLLPSEPRGAGDRPAWLMDIRRQVARVTGEPSRGRVSGALRQAMAQAVCGFHDLDLRDATGPGHGALILAGGDAQLRRRWSGRLAAGELVGIAATERHGGSRIQEMTTRATLHRDRWLISGEKVWVSRLAQAAAFVVFFRDPDGRISAAVVDATAAGLSRELVTPAGLGGWGWGCLRLHDVAVDPRRDVLGGAGSGLELFRSHFGRFRPLVTATALGTAAGVHQTVAGMLAARVRLGLLPRARDNALISLGRTHAQICGALLTALGTARLAALGHPDADLWARVGKAYGVDTAFQAVGELVPLVGAVGFQAGHPLAKARADLAGLLYADGIHDSLYRSGGLTVLAADASGDAAVLQRSTVRELSAAA